MDAKNAAKMLDRGMGNADQRPQALRIQDAMMTVYVDGLSSNQAERLANVFRFMKPDRINDAIANRSASEIVSILGLLEPKKVSAIMDGLQQRQPAKAQSVLAMMNEADA